MSTFKAVVVTRDEAYRAEVTDFDASRLAEGDVDVAVRHSTLNYKDALALTGKGPVVRSFPLVAGIDFAGEVTSSRNPDFQPGDAVLLNGYGLGETHHGGLAQQARVRGEWLVKIPGAFSTRQAMSIGTAGYTAALSVLALEAHGVAPSGGDVLVTGATGGVGSIATLLLAKRGYRVIASTGKAAEADWLRSLGAHQILDRAELSAPGKPLAKERWAAAIDAVGSHTLVNACAGTRRAGAVASCGMAQGMDFPGTVAPFILRGVALLGVDSVQCPMPARLAAWQLLAQDLDLAKLDELTTEITLAETIDKARELLEGRVRGRLVVDVNR